MMLALLLSLLMVLQSPDQVPTPQIKVQVNLVLVDVQVTENNAGRIIAGLDKSDFVLEDNGRTREVALLEPETVPLDLFLLWDTSNGPGGYPEDVFEDPRMLLRELQPADRVGVISFDLEVRLHTELTEERNLILSAIDRALNVPSYSRKVGGRDLPQRIYASNIYGALIRASQLFVRPRTEPRRRAVFVVTHNRNGFSTSTVDDVITELLEADATVEGLVVKRPDAESLPSIKGGINLPGKDVIWKRKPKRMVTPEGHAIDPIAEATGGEVFHYDCAIQGWWRGAIARLRSRYLLGFYAAPLSSRERGFRAIKVELSEKARAMHTDAIVRAPRGYYIATD